MTPPPAPPSRAHEGEVAAARRYERGLAVKALIALAVVAVLIAARILWF
jgi:hypothetical protein